MSVWTVFPSAAPVGQARLCVSTWQALGYRVAIAAEDNRTLGADWALQQAEYPGYAASVNRMAHHILANDPECQIVVAAADDLFPETRFSVDQIAAEFIEHFGGTLGVCQPCGDPWTLGTSDIPQARRVAGSPWMGREWCRRANQGNGPLWAEFYHCFEDNFLAETAEKLGLMWWREDLRQPHHHFMRFGNAVPEHAKHAYAKFAEDQELFLRLKAEGFPGSELAP